MCGAQWPGGAGDGVQAAMLVHSETSHVGRRWTGVGRIQDIQQPVLVGQANRTLSAGVEDSRKRQPAFMYVKYGDLVTARIHGEEPPAVAGADQRALRSICKGRQAT